MRIVIKDNRAELLTLLELTPEEASEFAYITDQFTPRFVRVDDVVLDVGDMAVLNPGSREQQLGWHAIESLHAFAAYLIGFHSDDDGFNDGFIRVGYATY